MTSLSMLLTLLVTAQSPPTIPIQGSPESWIDQLKTVSSLDLATESLYIKGSVANPDSLSLNFEILYQAPSDYGLCFNDGEDGTPILRAVKGHLFIYDPLSSSFLYSEAASVTFTLCDRDERIVLKLALEAVGGHDDVSVDLKSLISIPAIEKQMEQIDPQTLAITKVTEHGTRLNCIIRHSVDSTEEYALMWNFQDGRVVQIERLSVNQDGGPAWPFFPSREQLDRIARVEDFERGRATRLGTIFEYFERAYCLREAFQRPELRENATRRLGYDINWNELEALDKRRSQQLRDLVAPRPARLPDRHPPAQHGAAG